MNKITNGNLKFFLIVATRNRSNELVNLLESLSKQTYKNFCVIVVDQSVGEHLDMNRKQVQRWQSSIDIRYITTNTKGLSRARNIGLQYLDEGIVCFPDDDCWYGDDVIGMANEILKKNIEFEFISGQYSEPNVINEAFPIEACRIDTIRRASLPSSVTLFIRSLHFTNNRLHFDEDIGAGTALPVGEETDVVMELVLMKATGLYCPELLIFHPLPIEKRNKLEFRILAEKTRGYYMGKRIMHPNVALQAILGLLKLALKSIYSADDRKCLISRITGLVMGAALKQSFQQK